MSRFRQPPAGPAASRHGGPPRPARILLAGIAVLGISAILGSLVLGGIGFGRGPAGSVAGLVPSGADVGDSTDPTVAPSAVPAPGREVYGFVPYWEMDDTIVSHLAATRATTIALFSVTHTKTGDLAMNQAGARRIDGPIGRSIIADVHAHHRRVDLVYTSFGQKRNHALLGSPQLQQHVIDGLVALRADLGVDGIAVDVEQVEIGDIPAFGGFVQGLRAALVAADPQATVTVATGAGPAGASMALAATLAGADRIFLMAYDYRTRTSAPGATSPLTRRDGDARTIPWSLDLYAAAGIPPQRTLLGLPLYGISWPTDSPELGAPATGAGEVWIPRRNLATIDDPALTPVVDPLESVGFVAVPNGSTWRAIYWDTPASLAPKVVVAEDHGLAGIGLWALGYDRGIPGYADLIDRFRTDRLDPSPGPSAAP
jgi:spore germination protein YaaH